MKSIELEKALLGCLITDGKYIDSVKQYIPEDDYFYSSFNQKVWRALDKLNKNNKKIDTITVCEEVVSSTSSNADRYEILGF
jgi:replicative DNA helicase